MSLNLFIIGPSGCGKSTQAKLIAQKYNLTHFSTGQIFREEIYAATPLGLEAKKYIDQGLFCPDEILIPIVMSSLKKVSYKDFIIDGTPRRLNQAIQIQKILQDQNQDITHIIHLDVTAQEIVTRRLNQEKLGSQFQDLNRSDNTPEAIAGRQAEYDKNNDPIMEYFSKNSLLLNIDGNRPVQPIFEDICKAIDKIK
jgi:adenylate kinase